MHLTFINSDTGTGIPKLHSSENIISREQVKKYLKRGLKIFELGNFRYSHKDGEPLQGSYMQGWRTVNYIM